MDHPPRLGRENKPFRKLRMFRRTTPPGLGGSSAPRAIPAWTLSLLLHALLLFAVAFLMHDTPRGFPGEPDRPVGVALAQDIDGVREYLDSSEAQTRSTNAASRSQKLEQALPTEEELTGDLAALLPKVAEGLPTSGGLDLPSLGEVGRGRATGLGLSGQVSTSVFGASAEGSKFVYVFDRSGSMEGFNGRPLLAAKRELIRSLADLQDTSQFQIIFYNERPDVFRPGPGEPKLVWGNQAGKQQAEQFVRGIRANGGTRHLDALRLALGLAPDVVFFLTDADEPRLTDSELARLRQWNRSATIHSIEFGFGPQSRDDNFLVRLARQNGGQHVYVDVSKLPGP